MRSHPRKIATAASVLSFLLLAVACSGGDESAGTAESNVSQTATSGNDSADSTSNVANDNDSANGINPPITESTDATNGADDSSTSVSDSGPSSVADSGPTVPVAACGKAADPAGTSTVKLTVGGKTRSFEISAPAPTKMVSLVFVLHGDGGTGAGIHAGFPLEKVSGSDALVFYPDGTNKTWDLDKPENDLPFFDAMIDYAKAHYCVDGSRVFATGFSRGGYMSNQLGCFRGNVFKGIAPQSGGGPYQIGGKFDSKGQLICPGGTTSSMSIHGLSDSTVAPSEEAFSENYWIYKNQCTKTFTSSSPSPCQMADGCGGGRKVGKCLISGMGHSIWSNATQAVWGFFKTL